MWYATNMRTALAVSAALCLSCSPRDAATIIADEGCNRLAIEAAQVGAEFDPMFDSEPDMMADMLYCSQRGRPGAPNLVVACLAAVDNVTGRLSIIMRYAMAAKLAERYDFDAPEPPDHMCLAAVIDSF